MRISGAAGSGVSRSVSRRALPVEAPPHDVDSRVHEEREERRQQGDRVHLIAAVLLHGPVDDVAEARADEIIHSAAMATMMLPLPVISCAETMYGSA